MPASSIARGQLAHFAHCVLGLLGPRPSEPATVLNPLRSEGEMFRLLVYVIVAFAVIITLILVLRAVF